MNSTNTTKVLLTIFFLVKLCGFSQQKYSVISKQLDSIYYYDQKYRVELENINKSNNQSSKEFNDLRELIIEHDSINVRKVQRIIDEFGWLSVVDVGEKANQTLFLVIQHANLSIQEKYLPLIRSAVKNKKASSNQLALLEDRISIANGKEQIYGSQLNFDNKSKQYVLAPTFDEENLNKRRAQVGLPPIENYLRNFGITYKFNPKKESQHTNIKRINLILLGFILFLLIIVLFKRKKHSPWYWLFTIVILLTLIDLYFDYYRTYSMIKQYRESWILFSLSKPIVIFISILILNFIWRKLFSIENIFVNVFIILLSYICYFKIFSTLLQAILISDNSVVFFLNIIEPAIYVFIYLISWFTIYLIQKKRKIPI